MRPSCVSSSVEPPLPSAAAHTLQLSPEEGQQKEKDGMDTHTMEPFMSSPPILQRNRGQNKREDIIKKK